jgi:cytochrome c-type biogenesis protein CcmE
MNNTRMKLAIGIVLILGVLGWLGFSGIQEAKALYIFPVELKDLKGDELKQRMKVAGFVVDGTIKREEGKTQFTIEHEGVTLPVVYVGRSPLPDTFKDGAEAVVEGHYTQAQVFEAENVQAKCASKYEPNYDSIMQEEQPSGSTT